MQDEVNEKVVSLAIKTSATESSSKTQTGLSWEGQNERELSAFQSRHSNSAATIHISV